MAIKKIRISNFKSFKDLEIELGNFNVLIGANASGKSNFIQIFRFLKDIAANGLNNAISMQGGIDYFRNINVGPGKNFSVEVVYEPEKDEITIGMKDKILMKITEISYKFSLEFKNNGVGFEIYEDRLTQKYKCFKLQEIEEKNEIGLREVIFSRINGEFDIVQIKGIPIDGEGRPLFSPFPIKLPPNTLFLSNPFFTSLGGETLHSRNISIYDFDPKLSKNAIPMAGKAELEEDGSNLALVLKNVIEDKDRKRKFDNLIKYLLSFVKDLYVERLSEQYLLLKLQETYSKDHYLPAFLLSDGTINITALITALYFEGKPLTIIEEPERNIHPYLISKIIQMMKEVLPQKQIIVTTHNPGVVKYADLKDILLICRDKDGFSTILRPAEKKEIKTFLKNEIGIEELYAKKLLEM